MKRWLLICLLALTLNSCSALGVYTRPCSEDPACIHILFIGNSYTFVNDLPGTLVKLAASGGQRVETGLAATGGWSLSDHLKSADTLAQISGSNWNFVVLQEQSMIPASATLRDTQMYPAARALAGKIKAAGARTILFIPWAHRDGWPENNMPTYESMQTAINGNYFTLGKQLQASMAPVGFAWLFLHQQKPLFSLWQDDGSHPNEAGTYLAACVFYTILFHKSPEGLSYQGNVPDGAAKLIQKEAADTVFNSEKSWNLP